MGNPIQRNSLDNFYIDLEEPHKHYTPGDSVRGHVVILLLKPTRVSSLNCMLRGQISIKNAVVKGKTSKYTLFQRDSVLWGSGSADEDVQSLRSAEDASNRSSSNGKGSRRSLFRVISNRSNRSRDLDEENGGGDNNNNGNGNEEAMTLPRGEHAFEFEFELPKKDVYTSLEFERGSISYAIIATYQRAGTAATAVTTTRTLTVVSPIDVSKLSAPKPTCLSVEVRKKKKQQGSIVAVLELPHRGYLRGESIPVKLSIKHIKSIRSVCGVIVTLSRISRVIIEGSEPQTFRKDITQTVSPLLTDPETFTAIVKTAIRVPPDTFPTTRGHPVVSFQYCLEAVVDLAGSWGNKQQLDNNSGLGMIDTDKLVSRRGVVNLWADVVIGTDRSIPSSQFIPTPVTSPMRPRSGTALTMSSSETAASYPNNRYSAPNPYPLQSAAQDSPSPSYANGRHRHSLTSYDVPSYEQTSHSATQSALGSSNISEKERLHQMEQALLPSQPSDVVPEEEEEPSAPIADGEQEEDDLFVTPQVRRTHIADKREMERHRLLQLASEPEPEDVPLYEESPSAPPIRRNSLDVAGLSAPPPVDNTQPSAHPNGNGHSTPPMHNGGPSSPVHNDEPSAPPIHSIELSAPPIHNDGPSGPVIHNNEPSAPPVGNDEPSVPPNGEPPLESLNTCNADEPDDEEPSAPPIENLRLD
ncbi:hypothetical protein TRVA0_084S00232 [Trichomonascus vanleenenianus]|uniref:Rim8p n=1 Tax=Trichomonascus vanleenenianus TaxID=2268995 RepID=UPI003ECA509B